jgi:hypothetical protein
LVGSVANFNGGEVHIDRGGDRRWWCFSGRPDNLGMLLELAEDLPAPGRGELRVNAGVLEVRVAHVVGDILAFPSPWSLVPRAGGASCICEGGDDPVHTRAHVCSFALACRVF